jgi:hypothetical protein
MMASGTSKMREDVARAHAAARQAQDGVEAPARLVHLDRELFDQVVVFVVAHVQVLAVFGQHAGNSSIDSWLRRCNAGQRPIWISIGQEGVAHQDGVLAVGAGGHQVDRHAGDVLDALQVQARGHGQLS